MTTIAVCKREGVMAADTRVVTGGSYYHATKVFRIGDTLWGTAGAAFPCLAVIEWLKSPKRNPLVLHRAFADQDRDDVLLVVVVVVVVVTGPTYEPEPITPLPDSVMLGCGAWMSEAMLDAAVKPLAPSCDMALKPATLELNPAVAIVLLELNPAVAIVLLELNPAVAVSRTAPYP